MSNDNSLDVEPEDHQTRIQKMKEEVERITGVKPVSDSAADCPPEIEEQFWEHVLAYESATPSTLFDLLVKGGMTLPAPQEMEDTPLSEKLQQVINALALLGAYLENTDHLSDRELYTELWEDALREEAVVMPGDDNYACHIDLLGSGSEEDTHLYLKYYADEEHRRHWRTEFPDDEVPDHQQPPLDRDRNLPKPPF